jgi:hypothetical protein
MHRSPPCFDFSSDYLRTKVPAMTIGLLLTVIFLILKLTGNINWNWAIVFLPVIVEFVVSFSYARSPFWWRGRAP